MEKIFDLKAPSLANWLRFAFGGELVKWIRENDEKVLSAVSYSELFDSVEESLKPLKAYGEQFYKHQVWMLFILLKVKQNSFSREFSEGFVQKIFEVRCIPDYLKSPPYGKEFLEYLFNYIHSSHENKHPDAKVVKFPLVYTLNPSRITNKAFGVAASFEVFKIHDRHAGLFIHPCNAFTYFDDDFLSIFKTVLAKMDKRAGTVCVKIENFTDREKKYEFPILTGNSAGGALITALKSLKEDAIVGNNIAISFKVDLIDEKCQEVKSLSEKLKVLSEFQRNTNIIHELICVDPQETDGTELQEVARNCGIKLVFKKTIDAVFSYATGGTGAILEYLHDFIQNEHKTPLFFKPSNSIGELKYIDQNVNLKEYNVNRRESFSPGEHEREDSQRIKSSEILTKTANSNVNIIRASSGYGKSFLLIKLALEVATDSKADLEKTGDPKVKIPILISFGDLIKSYDLNCEAFKNENRFLGVTEILKFLLSLQNEKLCQKIDSNEVVIFIDSFDDISSDKRKILIEDLNFFKWLNKQKSPVFFSSRPPFDLEGLSKFNLIELELFGETSKKEFVQNWFGTPEAKNKYNLILKSPLSSIPLLLFFLCKIQERMQKDMNVVSLVKIYNAVVDQMIKEPWRNIQKKDNNDLKVIMGNREKKSGLAELSYMLFSDERSDIDIIWLINCGLPKDIIVALIQNNPIFVVNGSEEDQQFSFVHKSIQEFLVAFHLAETVNNTGWQSRIKYGTKEVEVKTLIDKKAWLSQWDPVVIFMSGLLHDVYKQDLLGIIRGTDDIFRHRLSLAARCLPEVLNNFSKN